MRERERANRFRDVVRQGLSHFVDVSSAESSPDQSSQSFAKYIDFRINNESVDYSSSENDLDEDDINLPLSTFRQGRKNKK